MSDHATIIRTATADDDEALTGLALIDRRRHPRDRALLAESDGDVVAAISLSSGAVFADPANPDAEAINSLRFRRYQILRQGGDVGLARALTRRLAPAV
jgi:hypothetical protein